MKFKSQLFYFILFLFNFIFNISPFFIKKYLLLMTNSNIGKNSYIHRGVRFFSFGRIRIGKNSTINFKSFLDNRSMITIGDNCMIGHHVKIYTTTHDFNDPLFSIKKGVVDILDNSVVFPNSLIMPNSLINEGVVILPGSVFSGKSIPYGIYGGVPAKLINKRKKYINYKLIYGYYFSN